MTEEQTTQSPAPAEEKKPRRIFRLAYILLCVLLAVLVAAGLGMLYALLRGYEAAQPQACLDKTVQALRDKLENGTAGTVLTVPEELAGSFAPERALYLEYASLLHDYPLTYVHKAGSDSADSTTYYVAADGKPFLSVTLHAGDTVTRLGFLTVTDYTLQAVTPVYSRYSVTLPAALFLTVDGAVQTGVPDADNTLVRYDITRFSTHEAAVLDSYGGCAVYDGKTAINLNTFSLTVPENYTVTVGNRTLSASEDAVLTDNPDYADVRAYCDTLPRQAAYSFSILGDVSAVSVMDNLGAPVAVTFADNACVIDCQAGTETLSADISAHIDPLQCAETWSLYMTKDLGTYREAFGYYKLKKYLINDSYLDHRAWEWATNIDIAFINYHTLCDPPFLEERVSNIIRYSDDFFSCDISFIKHMILEEGNDIRDPMSSTFYFYQNEPSAWYLVGIREILGQEASE